MIIIGYQGIGKSTLAKRNVNYVDLESGNFFIDGKRAVDWYKPYCKIAEHISQQGYDVFVSSHKVVRDTLKNSSETIMCCAPTIELKDFWIDRLAKRYEESQSLKDYKAWKNAEACYEENIKDIAASGFPMIWIDDPDYELSVTILKAIHKKMGKDQTLT